MTKTTNLPAWAAGLDLSASRKLEALVAQPVKTLAVDDRVARAEAQRREVYRRWFGCECPHR